MGKACKFNGGMERILGSLFTRSHRRHGRWVFLPTVLSAGGPNKCSPILPLSIPYALVDVIPPFRPFFANLCVHHKENGEKSGWSIPSSRPFHSFLFPFQSRVQAVLSIPCQFNFPPKGRGQSPRIGFHSHSQFPLIHSFPF
jgi:hypothetical protein